MWGPSVEDGAVRETLELTLSVVVVSCPGGSSPRHVFPSAEEARAGAGGGEDD